MSLDDERFMRRAIELAERGRWHAAPNPTVGAVLVKDGAAVAEGWHQVCGKAHAEVNCLSDAAAKGIDPEGGTLYVTLEPCNHYGKTPPCSKAVAEAGIRRVVIGMPDVNPSAVGGAEFLRSRGVEVVIGVLEDECRELVADFINWQVRRRPFVMVKMAMTLDGRIALRGGQTACISGPESHAEVMKLRASVGTAGGAVLVGGNTLRQDDPLLTARGIPCEKQPLAAVITSQLPESASCRLLSERAGQAVFLTSPAEASGNRASSLRALGARVYSVPVLPGGKLDCEEAVRILWAEEGCRYVLCEGGGRLAFSLLESGTADELRLHIAPVIYGDAEAPSVFTGGSLESAAAALRMRPIAVSSFGSDTHITLRPQRENG